MTRSTSLSCAAIAGCCRPRCCFFFCVFWITVCVTFLRAQTEFTWVGGGGTWNTPAKWNPPGVPGELDTATIATGDVSITESVNVASLHFLGGTVSGGGTQGLTVMHSGSWTGGTVNNTKLTIAAGGSLLLSGASAKQLSGGSGVITNLGTVTWTGGPFNLENNAQFLNQAGALFDVQTDAPLAQTGGGTSVFRNEGTYLKSADTATHIINLVSFINNGTVRAASGIIRLRPSTLESSKPGNTFHVEDGAEVQIGPNAGSASITDTTFSGAGAKTLNLGAGGVTVNGIIAATNLVFAGGTWQGQSTLTGLLNWTGGTMSNAQLTVAAGGSLALSGASAKQVTSGVITNLGTVTWTGGPFNVENNVQFLNQAGALFDVQTDAPLAQTGAGTSVFRNEGTYLKSAGTGTHNITLASFVQSGLLAIDTGIVKVVGNYAQGAGSTLKTTVSGSQPGTGFGQLQVTGNATLDGTVAVVSSGDPNLAAGESLELITAGSRAGLFAIATGRSLGNDLFLTPSYGNNGVSLRVVGLGATLTDPAQAGAQFQFNVLGVAGQAYRIDASTNFTDWVPLSSVSIPGSGVAAFMAEDIPNYPQRYYRAVFTP